MLNIDAYKSAIQHIWFKLLFKLAPIMICGIALIVIALIGLFKHLFKKSEAFPFLILAVILLSYSIIEISVFNYDIKHANFDVYYGEFDYKHVTGKDDVIKLPKGSGLHLRCEAHLGIDNGSHFGYLLYCKKSRWVIAYSNTPFE